MVSIVFHKKRTLNKLLSSFFKQGLTDAALLNLDYTICLYSTVCAHFVSIGVSVETSIISKRWLTPPLFQNVYFYRVVWTLNLTFEINKGSKRDIPIPWSEAIIVFYRFL